jgi:hypothetical protein
MSTEVDRWLQRIYFIEFLFIVVPATFFEFITFFLLIGYAGTGANPSAAFQLSLLWVGGAMGTYSFWVMYVRLLNMRFVLNYRELPFISLICGVIANVIPVLIFLTFNMNFGKLMVTLLFFAPTIVALHWIFALINKMPNLAFERDAAKARRPSTLR